jgi:acyl-coenzyme A synthetase/AMP-(fatty) acid ligase
VSPIEIEQVIARHPAVLEAAVIGIRDDLKGEVPAAFVVGRVDQRPTAEELRRFCHQLMPAYRVPVTFTFVEALPRNEAGKLLRAELASQHSPR